MNTTRPCFLPIFILLPIYGDTRNKLINKFYNYLHTFLDKPYLKGRYSANALSNFYSHSFAFEGFKKIPCMEAFLQSLKFEDLNNQRYMLYLNAKEAKIIGGAQSWD